jgi:hypothetical protein
MKLTKKNFLSIINEMAMDYETGDRPHGDIERKLSTGETPLKKIPLPKTGEEPNKNFQEILASTRYKEVVSKVRQYTRLGNQSTIQGSMQPLTMMMMDSHNKIVNIESRYKEQLQNLAVELVKKEMGLTDEDFTFDAKIVGMGQIETQDFNREMGEDQNIDEVEIEKDLFDDLETLDLEKAKRRLINSMIQGSSKKGHYMYHMVSDSIREITGSEDLVNLYGILMSVNDTLYWQLSDDTMKMMMGGGGGPSNVGGKESVDRNTQPPTITARAVNFPILVHELIKGVMEVLAIKGRPKDEEGNETDFEDVESSEDTLEKEMWDLRLGPAIWERVRNRFPEEILVDEDKYRMQLILFSHIIQKPAKEFLIFMKEILSNSERGGQLMNLLYTAIEQEINDYDYTETMNQFDQTLDDISNETDDGDFDDFLGSLGIRRPDDEE